MLRKGTIVKSKPIGCVDAFVGVIVAVLRTHKRAIYYHVRDRETGQVWHRDREDLIRYPGGNKHVRRARARSDSVHGVGRDHGVVTL